jgi:hypothetical protein
MDFIQIIELVSSELSITIARIYILLKRVCINHIVAYLRGCRKILSKLLLLSLIHFEYYAKKTKRIPFYNTGFFLHSPMSEPLYFYIYSVLAIA